MKSLFVTGNGIPLTWEAAVNKCDEYGVEIKTEYDTPDDPPSKDCTMMIEIMDPMQEPMIHRFMPAGPKELECYCMELCEGIKDHLVRPGLWPYTYHALLADQFQYIRDKLIEAPYTRRAQATTWIPNEHCKIDDPPCLQRIWCRMEATGTGGFDLYVHTHWRSRDALKVAFRDIFGLVFMVDSLIRWPIQQALGVEIKFARYVDISDSFHIYGKDYSNLHKFRTQKGQTFNYEGELDEIMAGYRDEIRAEVTK